MSDSPGLMDFAIGLVNSVVNLTDRQVKFLEDFKLQPVKSILLIKMFLGLVEMTFGLVYASFSLPEWQALKVTFFAPWPYLRFEKQVYRNYCTDIPVKRVPTRFPLLRGHRCFPQIYSARHVR